jgi:hypothetical protein
VRKEEAMCPVADSLWPEDLSPGHTKAPATILRKQGLLLGKMTDNLVVGRVVAHHEQPSRIPAPTMGPRVSAPALPISYFPGLSAPALPISYSFELVAPVLNDYAVELFCVRHGGKLYPATISSRLVRGGTAKSPEQFMELLKTIFNSEKTKNIIQSLLAQSQAPV